MARDSASRPDHAFDHDLRTIVHQEINRLPASQRLPVVLCDLQGLTYNQAADQLRWTEPTLRCRLARARQRLKGRRDAPGLCRTGGGSRPRCRVRLVPRYRRC